MSLTSTRLSGWLRRHGVTGLCMLVVLLITLSLTRQSVDFLRLLRDTSPTAPAQTQATQPPPVAIEQLQNLFGTPAQSSSAPPPTTTLQLSLLGSFVSPQPQRSSAIIQVMGSPPKRLLVGEAINASTRLRAVHQDHVLLERNDREESLYFPQVRKPAANSGQQQPATTTTPTAEQLQMLQDEDVQNLQQHLQTLQQQLEGDGSEPPPTDMPEAETSQ
ncbi:MAG TPA: type II secretion system protein N [Pseudomonas sp.]|nr:type II secretion system protein N [Pseudomonas sp.]